ncbi:MAG: CRISPR-associated helicase Cas3' [Chloroflexota bacterium]
MTNLTDDPIPCAAAEWHNILAKPTESLVKHTWHVLSRLADQIRLHPTLSADTQTPELWHWLFWGTFLHDFGKCAAGFQAMLKAPSKLRWPYRHEALSLAFVDWVFPRGDVNRAPVIAVIACHHKDASLIIEKYGAGYREYPEDDLPLQLISQVSVKDQMILYHWLTNCAWKWAKLLGFDAHISPVTMPTEATAKEPLQVRSVHDAVEDLRSYTSRLSFKENAKAAQIGMLLRGMILIADHAGSASNKAEPFISLDLPSPTLMAKLLKPGAIPYAHQDQSAACDAGSAMLIAPTGSGKTESALLWLDRQAALDGAPPSRVFYILPYQASMNAMYKRLGRILGKKYIGLQHGHAQQAIYYAAISDAMSTETATNSAKINEEVSRLHRHPMNVQSPYQMLKSPYQMKGHEALFANFQGGCFILDEIHAYEAERLAMIVCFIAFLRKYAAARFFIMSATMPTHVRDVLREAIPDLQLIEATPKTFTDFKRHCMHLLDGSLSDPHIIGRICADANDDKSVLICCNTVKQAKNIHALLRAQFPDHPIILVHSRFNSQDRSKKEQSIMEQADVDSKNTYQGLKPIVVATQVVEVSLNIDMDTLYSEIAPMEALLQRFGRVNRSRPKGSPLANVYIVREQPDDVKYLYSPDLLDATLRKLEAIDGQSIEEGSVGAWLDEIYAGEALTTWWADYRKSEAEFKAAILDSLKPFATDNDIESLFYQMFNGVEVLPSERYDEYQRLMKSREVIEAASLLVPLRWGQYKRLEKQRKAWPEAFKEGRYEERLYLVDAVYSSENGLDIEGAMQTEIPMEAD